ncbi:bis(5'-adenosyl)-triphosphatase ENPP4 isoform X2 [Folsomia candida]|uniref:Ectonucleotide pyrophosphatase/phosphodiesterase family member 5 n=2 Tax=Folsomia candida TaxID=158441 RepID=A0A226EGI6_FOLCA|nr:bis(5'-adenosyl)-triphosphatase ENPP4 isoform X2 [Folsomia candida]XP_035705158.1 bis(5'-adenosyl)-triphosphatase ENPP4 isoform X2 [Folsomia candida]OXA56725.1 Ectonucleotide pyrophosphatase/phosphodiesterase family member 5 [Folsomia candida]
MINLLCSVLLICITQQAICSHLSKHPVLLTVSFDGFRYDYMSKADMPTLRVIQEEGVSVPYMKAQFPTKTFPNHQSIATGVYPDIHGITDNTVYDPMYGKKLSGFSDDPAFWNYSPDVIPFWIRNEQAGEKRFSGCYMWAGSTQRYGPAQLLPTYYIPKYNGSVPWEERVETVISWMTDPDKPANMVFLYHNEPDSRGHTSGTDDPETIAEIKKVDQRVAHLVQRLKASGIYEKINLVILSDHGMQNVHKENMINTTGFADPQTYFRNGNSPVFHIKPKNKNDTAQIYEAFRTASIGKNFSVYRKNDLGHLKYGKSRRIADIVLLADPGYGFEDLRFNDAGVTGVHGYDNNNQNMTAIFMARGPNFKRSFKSSVPIENVDLVALFSKIMQVPLPNTAFNGTAKTVSEFLTTANASSNRLNWNMMGVIISIAVLRISMEYL